MNITFENTVDFEILDKFLESAKNNQNGFVMYDTPYAIYVEYPTEYTSKKPPIEPILEWVKRNIATDEPEETAFKIQNHIYENGTDGVFYLNRTKKNFESGKAEDIIDSYNGNIENAPENIMENILTEILRDSNEIIKQEAYDTGNLLSSHIIELTSDSNLVE